MTSRIGFLTPTFLWVVVGLTGLTACEYRIVERIQRDNRFAHEEAAAGIISGHPHWRIYQSRVLGPGLVVATSRITGWSFSRAYGAVEAGLLFLGNATCFLLFRRRTAGVAAWTYTLAYASLFIALQDRAWLYLWDYIDMIVFLVFAWAVVTRASALVLTGLFVCELLNREAALIIAAWIAMESVTFRSSTLVLNWRRGLLGLGLLVIGGWWLFSVRSLLFISETRILPPGYSTIGDAHWMLPINYAALVSRPLLDSIRAVLALSITGTLIRAAWVPLGDRAWHVATLLSILIGSTILVGLMTETRVWLCVSPFWLWLAYTARQSRPWSGAPSQVRGL